MRRARSRPSCRRASASCSTSASPWSAAPSALLLDEPTSGISAEEKFPLMDLVMDAVGGGGTTVLFVEHDMEIVERYAGAGARLLRRPHHRRRHARRPCSPTPMCAATSSARELHRRPGRPADDRDAGGSQRFERRHRGRAGRSTACTARSRPRAPSPGSIGRNGAGKTTLMRAIMGLLPAAAGSMRIVGQDLLRAAAAGPRRPRHRLHAGGSPPGAGADRRGEHPASPAGRRGDADADERLALVYEILPEVATSRRAARCSSPAGSRSSSRWPAR